MKVGFDVRVSALCLLLAPTVSSTGAAETVADTKFSVNRGFYVIPFRVKISSVTPDAEIRYTTDGSEPALNHGSGGPSPQLVEVTTTTVLRAKAFREGLEPTNVDTQTYLFTNHVLEQPDEIPGYPSLVMRTSGSTSATLDYGMDPEIARDPAYRERLLDGLESIPSISLVLPKEHMFGHGGIYYATDGNGPTHAASVEVLYADEPDASFQVDCGLESHATVAAKRSFKLKFQSEFGPGKLVTPFFRGSPLNGDSATTVIDRIVLRAGNERSFALRGYPHRTTYARDEWARDSQIAMTGAGSRGLFVHLYINGLYWGLYNAVERPDAWFTSAYFGGTPDDWAVVNHGGRVSGSLTRWDYLRRVLKSKNMTEAAHFEELEEYLDVTRFADYLILAFYAGFGDWPFNNWYGANRNREPGPFMFFVWDAEVSWVWNRRRDGARRRPDRPWNIQEHFRSSLDLKGPTMVGIWHAARKNIDFMMLFADRVYEHCFGNGALSDARSLARWDVLTDTIAQAVVAESARWGDVNEELGDHVRTAETFDTDVARVRSMMDGAASRLIDTLRREGYYPNIDPPRLEVSRGFLGRQSFSASNPNDGGVVYYTADGTDPRAAGGAVAASASIGEDKERLRAERDARIKARVLKDGVWSALATATTPLPAS